MRSSSCSRRAGSTAADRDGARAAAATRRRIAALNKVDRLKDKARLLPYIAEVSSLHSFAAIVPISAEKGWQLDVLGAEIAKLLPEGRASLSRRTT